MLAGSHLIREGFVPWRDVLLAHGLLFDAGNGLVGIELIDDSRWGIAAGLSLLVVPLSWVALYYLCAYLFGANWLFLLGTQLLVFTGDLFIVHTRFLLLPFAFVVFAALLQRPTVVRAVGLAFLLAAQVIVSPEAMVAAVAFLGTLVLFEGVYYGRGRGLVAGFRRTFLVLVTLLVLALVWSSFLAATGTLDDWAFSFTTMLPGHALTGGIPFSVSNSDLEVVSPVVLVLGVFAFVVARTLVRRPLAIQDWVMVAMATLDSSLLHEVPGPCEPVPSRPFVLRRGALAPLRGVPGGHVRRAVARDARASARTGLVPSSPYSHDIPPPRAPTGDAGLPP